MSLRSAIIPMVLLLGASIWPAACSTDQGNPPPLMVRNETSVVVNVYVEFEDLEEIKLLSDLEPGATKVVPGSFPVRGCTSTGILIARDLQDMEVARRSGEVCPGDTWVVEIAG